jgi:pyruvate dehydrogenase E1 component alpha subunit
MMDSQLRLKMYRDMLRIRQFEEIVRDRFADGTVSGSVHLYIGEEAVAVGACSAINKDDYLTSSHRGHGHVLAKGGEVRLMMAELFAKAPGYNRAKGGSMHLAAPEIGVLGANGIVGGGIPIATGAAMAAKKLKNHRVCLCFFGDGGSNQGAFHEGINIAASYALPCVYICENNMYAGGIKQYYDGVYRNEGMDYPRKVKDIADRAKGYDIPGYVVDGNDVEAVYDVVARAVKYAREGKGPTLIECKTYRWRTHFEVEPDTYRDPEEVARWKARCPIKNYGEKLIKEGAAKQADLDAIAVDVKKEMDDAVQFALESPEPDYSEALRDVYAE